jgi:alkylated DNA repair dioxygenase AlkB
MATSPDLQFQSSLFAAGDEPRVDAAFTRLVRHQLDDEAWVDHCPGFIADSDRVFDDVMASGHWAQHERLMYGERVMQPRLNAAWPDLPIIEDMRVALSERYGVDFVSGGCNLYRDGRDSVAWHRDKIAKTIVNPTVAIVSLGEPRSFLMRPRGGGRSTKFVPVSGDLIVTGGTAQRTWEHTVPKVRQAGPRMSITFRHR